MGEVAILDVGHGNSAIVHDPETGTTLVVDAPLNKSLEDGLRDRHHLEIRAALISHSDADHLGGMADLLMSDDFSIDELWINPDAKRRHKFWDDFKVAVRHAREKHRTRVRTELTTESSEDLNYGPVRIQVLYPPPDVALGGVGGEDREGRVLTTNAMSAVLRVLIDEEPLALLTGDLTPEGFAVMEAEGAPLRAKMLVFPHHGGHPSPRATDDATKEFAERLTSATAPEVIVFSIGRGQHSTPQPAVVAGSLVGAPEAHIACTQMSTHCGEILAGQGHLSDRYAHGRRTGSCCAGTVVLNTSGVVEPSRENHLLAILERPRRLCARPASADDAERIE